MSVWSSIEGPGHCSLRLLRLGTSPGPGPGLWPLQAGVGGWVNNIRDTKVYVSQLCFFLFQSYLAVGFFTVFVVEQSTGKRNITVDGRMLILN